MYSWKRSSGMTQKHVFAFTAPPRIRVSEASHREKQWWQTSLASLLDTQHASGSAEYTSSPLRIRTVARRPLPFPGLTNRFSFGGIVGFTRFFPAAWTEQCLHPQRQRRRRCVMTSPVVAHVVHPRDSYEKIWTKFKIFCLPGHYQWYNDI